MSENYRKPIVKILMLKGKDGDGKGISSISKTGTSGLVDTYTIALTDGTKSTFTVTNGAKGDKGDTGLQGQQGVKGDTGPQGQQGVKGKDGQSIKEIKKTSTSGLTDTYEISLTDGTKKSFTVTNGKGIKSIAKTSTSGLVDTYTITYTDGTTSTFTVTNGSGGGSGNGITSISKTSTSGLVDTYTIMMTDGTKSTFTVTNGAKGDKGDGLQDLNVNGMNLIIKKDLKNGRLSSSGDIDGSGTDYTNTDYIPSKSVEAFTISWEKDGGVKTKWLGIYYYDSNKKLINYNYKQVSGNPFIITIITPDRCAYLRIYWEGSKDEKIKIERGKIATDWIPSLEDIKNEIAKDIYPVGSIYMSVNSTEPSTLFGGTWERLKGRFLIGAGAVADTNSNTNFGSLGAEKPNIVSGETGGQYYHKLNIDEMPEHHHDTNDYTLVVNKNAAQIKTNMGAKPVINDGEYTNIIPNIKATKNEDGNATGDAGGDGKHNNMPPYLAVYMWKRTA